MLKCSPWNLPTGKSSVIEDCKKRKNKYYKQVQINLQSTHFTTVSLKTHLYGAANKNTSDGQNPAEKEDDKLDCSSLLLKL